MKDTLDDHRLDPKNPRNHFMGQPIISDQISREGLGVVWRNLEKILKADVPGDIVEFGCYAGTTSLFIRRLLNKYATGVGQPQHAPVEAPPHEGYAIQAYPEPRTVPQVAYAGVAVNRRTFHVYDSFEGLPEKSPQDANAAGVDFEAGKLYVSKKEFLQTFKSASLQPPVIHKGWFNELSIGDLPEQIAFAFLDGDFYDSIISSLRLVYPRMSKGSLILIDDYKRETLPGVERAIRDFFQNKPGIIANPHDLPSEANIAIIQL